MKLTKKQKRQVQYWFALLFITYALGLWLWAYPQTWPDYQQTTVTRNKQTISQRITNAVVPKGTLARVTGFSSVECHTTWCQANKGLPRGNKVAVNAKYGKVKRVYIGAFDKYYDVIGTTDYKTDVDIWFGDDQQSAKELGFKELTVNLIY
jgi:hypothetical protein